jgi:hypothetical protein
MLYYSYSKENRKEFIMLFEVLYKGMDRYAMINHIHMECDTSSGLRSMSDSELINVYKSVFGSEEEKDVV